MPYTNALVVHVYVKKKPKITRCVCETRMPRKPPILRNITFIFDLDLCR